MANRVRGLPLGILRGLRLHHVVKIVEALAENAAAAKMEFLVIGGNAVNAYGYDRVTSDLDLLVRKADRRAWDTLILRLDFRPHQITMSFHMYNPKVSGQRPVDLMLVDDPTFEKMRARAVEWELDGAKVHIPALPHLIAMKLHALRSGAEHRRARDLSDVATLIQMHKLDLATPEYAEIVERYATPEIVAAIRVLLAGPKSAGP